MRLKTEEIQLRADESFRLLRWQNNIHEVEIAANDGSYRPFVGSGHVWHHHSQMELTLVAQGSGTRFIGDSISHFKAPDLVLIGPNLPHYWHMRQHSSGYAIQFDFDSNHPFWQWPETRELRGLWSAAQRGIHVTGPAVQTAEEHIRNALTCGGMSRLTRFMQILETLARVTLGQQTVISTTTFAPPLRQTTYRSLQKAIHLVFHRFQEDLAFADVLRETRMSKATFERHFKKHTGKTFTGFVTEVRLNFASRQLIETELSISEIALAAGFNTISHFNHQFCALHHQSPRTYRKTMKERTEA